MSDQTYESPPTAPPPTGLAGRVVKLLPGPLARLAREVGEPLDLLGRLISTVIRNPRGFWGDTRDDMYYVLKRIFIPGSLSLLGYGMLAATFALAILLFLGAANRLGTVYLSFIIREIAPYITSIAMAGIVGTATTAEIGARKIRGELDAMRVMGQDPVRLLVLPRVIACMIVMCFMNLYVIALTTLEGVLMVMWIGDTSAASFLSSFLTNLTVPEVIGNVTKTLLLGLFIGIVCASKGLTSARGSEGLGRAVNQAVVITTLSVLVIDVTFNTILQGLVPSMTVSR